MDTENETKIFEKMIAIYDYHKGSKTISFESNGKDLFKSLLFKFCFLKDKGSAKFEKMKDIWFFKTFEYSKQKLLLDIVNLFICKINDRSFNTNEKIKQIIENLINLESNDILKTFKYLQSIYSYYTDKNDLILFPLFYSLAFSKDIQNNLKSDILAIIDNFKENYSDNTFFNDIDFTSINTDFLSKINILIYNMKKKVEINDVLPLYKHLCSYSSSSFPLNKQYSEVVSYFSIIKNNDLDKKIEDKIKSDKITIFSDINLEQNVDSKIINIKNIEDFQKSTREASTNTDSSEDKDMAKVEKPNENPSNNENLNLLLRITCKYSDAKALTSNILNIFDLAKNDISYLDTIHELKIENTNNQILLNKLSSAIVLLGNSNIINIKRKIIECLIFEIVEKYYPIFSISPSYYPTKSNLIDLKNLIIEKIQKYEKTKEKTKIEEANTDIKRLEKIMEKSPEDFKVNINNEKNSDKIFLSVKIKEKNGKKIFAIYEFLKFCKKFFHSYVHASSDKIDFYLLPRCLFNADIIYYNYIFSLDEFTDNDNIDDNNIININNDMNNSFKDFDTFSLYSDIKIITIDKALEILFSKGNNYFKDKLIPELEEKKKQYKTKYKIFKKYFEYFMINNKNRIIEEITEKEEDFNKQLVLYDKIMSEIIADKINRNDAKKKIDEIKDIILSSVNNINGSINNLINSIKDLNVVYDKVCSEVRKLVLLLKFMEKQREKFNSEQTKIFQEYKEILDDVLEKTKEAKELIKKNCSFNNDFLFDKWKESNPPKNLLNYDLIDFKNIMKKLIPSVKLDLSLSFDEKFVFWAISNNYLSYFK